MYTLAVPPALPFSQPIQLTDVPVKVKVAVEPGMLEVAVTPSVQARERLSNVHPPVYLIEGSVSS